MLKILVIEDAHPLRNDIIELLSFEGYTVEGAENGVVGVEVAKHYRPDLIVCDIMMPELDGYGVLDELRKDHQTATIPFIFLTAKTDKTDVRLGMGLGADDYVTKPFLTADLLKTIRARLDRRAQFTKQAERQMGELRESILTALPHELRTPLNSIIGFSEMLMAESQRLKPEVVHEWSQQVNTAALRLYRLIENYLIYVRVETAARDPQKRAAMQSMTTKNPRAVIEYQALHKAQELKRDADLRLAVEDVPFIRVTQNDLGKIIDELVDNALKFSKTGTKVELSAQSINGSYLIAITDHGRGMQPEQVQSVGAYMQFDRWLYEQQGTGLGLAICRRLVDIFDGTLTIESVPDQGTTVRLKLAQA